MATPIVLVTGADGFVGRHATRALALAGWHVRSARRSPGIESANVDSLNGLELGPSTDWKTALSGVQVVIHLAARAHRSTRIQKNEKNLYYTTNVLGTLQLARSAISAGVKQFIFLSSIAVNGNTTDGREPFSEDDRIAPNSVYGQSKAAAEQGLSELARHCRMSIVTIRAPMIYGAGAGGNFSKLVSAVRAGIPLPFGLVKNRRAFLGIDNLISFILHHLSAPASTGFEVFLVADEYEVSTPDFIRKLARASARSARLLALPPSLLRLPLNALGLSEPLLSSLQMNLTKAHRTGWECPLTLDEGLSLAVSKWT